VWIYSAQTIYNQDPLNRPKKDGFILKNQVEEQDAKKILDLFGNINKNLDSNGDSNNNSLQKNSPNNNLNVERNINNNLRKRFR